MTGKAIDDAFYDDYADRWLKSHDANETSLQTAVEKFLRWQGDDVAEKLESLLGASGKSFGRKSAADSADDLLPHVFTPSAWTKAFADAIEPALAYATAAGASHELASFSDWSGKPLKPPANAPAAGKAATLGYDFGVDFPPDMLAGIEAAVNDALSKDYWAEIQETTKDRLAEVLTDSLDQGQDPRTITKRVRDEVFDGAAATKRARTIARTETTNMLNAGQDVARQELSREGLITGKEWFATYDGLTRPTHFAANGQRKGVDEDFDVGGHPAKYPGDPELPAKERANCRCVASSVTALTKRVRAPLVKGLLSRGCEIHGR
ncbi:MAG TPA: phage minor head protein [Pirellulales bacterium]|nr:phage minor head protein [Pirellulales bacterium]